MKKEVIDYIIDYVLDFLGFVVIFTIIILIGSKIGIVNFSIWTIVGGAIGWILSEIIFARFFHRK